MGLSVRHLVHQWPKGVGMVVVHRMAKFVENHVVYQMRRQCHEIDRQVDAIRCWAWAPSCFRCLYLQVLILESMLLGQFKRFVPQNDFCLFSQFLDNHLFHPVLFGFSPWNDSRRIPYDILPPVPTSWHLFLSCSQGRWSDSYFHPSASVVGCSPCFYSRIPLCPFGLRPWVWWYALLSPRHASRSAWPYHSRWEWFFQIPCPQYNTSFFFQFDLLNANIPLPINSKGMRKRFFRNYTSIVY